MSEEKKDYVVYGMRAKCSEGTMENYISTDVGHGVTYQDQPLLNANDHTVQVNLTHFGDCNSKKIYEDAKKQADEKYKADADDGFFAKAAKWVVKTATKSIINAQEHLMFHKCELDTPLPWMFCNEEHMIDGAPALTMESQCPCRRGGVITIVPVVEEGATIEAAEGAAAKKAEHAESTTATTVQVDNAIFLAGPAPVAIQTADNTMPCLPRGGVASILENNDSEAVQAEIEEMRRKIYMPIIEKYVNEETLGKINPRWTQNMDTFKEVYGEDVFEQMREGMYNYGITNETSILMFLATMGNETGYGKDIIQGGAHQELANAEYREQLLKTLESIEYQKQLQEVSEGEESEVQTVVFPQIDGDFGIGLHQVTDESQGYFIKDLYNSLDKGDPERARIEKFFSVTEEDFLNIEPSQPADFKNMAGFICMYYPIEASMWFWGGFGTKCATFEGEAQTNYTINDYIVEFEDANLNNVFLGMQYSLNSLPKTRKADTRKADTRMKKSDVEDICNTKEDIADTSSTGIVLENGESYPMPAGWVERSSDWEQAQKLLK